MYKNNELPQAGNPSNEVNPDTDSDRVKASVVSERCLDFGGSILYVEERRKEVSMSQQLPSIADKSTGKYEAAVPFKDSRLLNKANGVSGSVPSLTKNLQKQKSIDLLRFQRTSSLLNLNADRRPDEEFVSETNGIMKDLNTGQRTPVITIDDTVPLAGDNG